MRGLVLRRRPERHDGVDGSISGRHALRRRDAFCGLAVGTRLRRRRALCAVALAVAVKIGGRAGAELGRLPRRELPTQQLAGVGPGSGNALRLVLDGRPLVASHRRAARFQDLLSRPPRCSAICRRTGAGAGLFDDVLAPNLQSRPGMERDAAARGAAEAAALAKLQCGRRRRRACGASVPACLRLAAAPLAARLRAALLAEQPRPVGGRGRRAVQRRRRAPRGDP
mmetsp:Transcript_92029/g.264813  ORF Transcript_92029/g.264813 Transcript_92029/m.264813 type:complete len:226 (-) Transcript_92029:217-894(-)